MAKLREGYVRARSDNLPHLDLFMIMEFASNADEYVSSEIRNIKSDRSMRESYISTAVGRVSLKRESKTCKVRAEMCPEHGQHSSNYQVSILIDEEKEEIKCLKCYSCAASQGGCKHALALLMWVFNESSKPSPTDVMSYWNKPKLSNISTNMVIKTKDFGEVKFASQNCDAEMFMREALSSNVAASSFQRYHTDIDDVSKLDLYQLCLQYVKAKGQDRSFSPSDFRVFCRSAMTEKLCSAAFTAASDHADSRHWHLLRYARISASNVHTAAHSKKPDGGVFKEILLGAAKLRMTNAMQRGKDLESRVFEVVQNDINEEIKKVGIKLSAELPEFGASPDGLTSQHVIEIKYPLHEKTLKNYIKNDQVVAKFLAQVQLQMKMCGRSKALFCVASPDFESSKIVKILEVDFDEELLASLVKRARAYWEKHVFPILLESVLR